MGSDAGQARLGVPLVRLQALPGDLHPRDMGETGHAAEGVSSLRQEVHNMGEIISANTQWLCKYIRADGSERIGRIEMMVADGAFYCPPVSLLNDLFEFRFRFVGPRTRNVAKCRYLAEGQPDNEIAFASWFSNIKRQGFAWWFQNEVWHDLAGTLGVLSLTSSAASPVMWAHYAHNHTGVCVLVRLSALSTVSHVVFGPVSYARQYPVLNYFQQSDAEIVKTLVLTKSIEWKYEKEYRLIVVGAGSTVRLGQQAVCGLILGHAVDKSVADRLKSCCAQASIPLYKAQPSLLRYELALARVS
jgi:hypothetical protein